MKQEIDKKTIVTERWVPALTAVHNLTAIMRQNAGPIFRDWN